MTLRLPRILPLAAAAAAAAAASLACGQAPGVVLSTLPADGETAAVPSWPWRVTFSAPMAPDSLRWSSSPEVEMLPASWDDAQETVTLAPAAPLPYSSVFDVAGSASDRAGNTASFHFSFVTREDRDVPWVMNTSPANRAAGVPTDTTITVRFSEPMAPATERGFSFYPAIPCPFTASPDGAEWSCRPLVPLKSFSRYVLAIDSQATDLASNPLMAWALTFTTGASADVVPPRVIGSTPADGATGVSALSEIEIRFSESMDAASASAAFAVTSPPGYERSVCRWNVSQTIASCSVSPLPPGAAVSWGVGADARDVAGNPLGTAFSASFQVSAQ
ncbi:MAG TPA: Ig-like domain-containing protein [Gemmatimonadales bacterium]|nr:Ig-like domain-containing protein [Gemmatimonadales bacterium]